MYKIVNGAVRRDWEFLVVSRAGHDIQILLGHSSISDIVVRQNEGSLTVGFVEPESAWSDLAFLPDGDYALATFEEGGNVSLARSDSGIYPIYVARATDGATIIGSHWRSVAEAADRKVLDRSGVELSLGYEFLFDPFTFISGVHGVPRGQRVSVDDVLKLNCVPSPPILASDSLECASDALLKQFREGVVKAVERRLKGVPIVLLSGGIDSNAMLAVLRNDLGRADTIAVTFRVLGAPDESPYAAAVAKHFDVHHVVVDIDPNNADDFEASLKNMNAPYFGALAIVPTVRAVLQGGRDAQTIFAGQDTRLHTPYLGNLDEIFVSRIAGHRRRFVAARIAAQVFAVAGGYFAPRAKLSRAARMIAQSRDWRDAVLRRYLKRQTDGILVPPGRQLEVDMMMRELVETIPYGQTKQLRTLFNAMVACAWSGQYTYDMQYMRDTCLMAGARCALPFYDIDHAQFCARLPYDLVTRTAPGTAGFDINKRIMVNKIFLREAFAGDLPPREAARAKAVSNAAALFCNGCLRPTLLRMVDSSPLWDDPALDGISLSAIRAMIRGKDGRWVLEDSKVAMQAIALLVIESAIAPNSAQRY